MRRVLRAALCAALVLSATAVLADPPAIVGDTKVKPGKMLRLSVELKPGESALWDAYPPDKVDGATWTRPAVKSADGKSDKPAQSHFNATGLGTVYVKVTVYKVVPGDGGAPAIVTDAATVPVTFGQAAPPPPAPDDGKKKAGPAPQPKPAPTPDAVPLVFAVVESGPARTPDVARVMGDTLFWKGLKDRGHSYFHYKAESPEAAGLGYLDEMKAQSVNPPALLVMSPVAGSPGTATIRACVALPKTTAEIDAIGKRYSTK